MVTRLVSHKGLDLVKEGIDNVMTYSNAQFVVLGSGDLEYENFFRWMQERVSRQVRAVPGLCARALPEDLRRGGHLPHAQQVRALRACPR